MYKALYETTKLIVNEDTRQPPVRDVRSPARMPEKPSPEKPNLEITANPVAAVNPVPAENTAPPAPAEPVKDPTPPPVTRVDAGKLLIILGTLA